MDSLAWKVAQKYLDKSHPCNQFLVKAFEGRGTLDSEAVAKGVAESKAKYDKQAEKKEGEEGGAEGEEKSYLDAYLCSDLGDAETNLILKPG